MHSCVNTALSQLRPDFFKRGFNLSLLRSPWVMAILTMALLCLCQGVFAADFDLPSVGSVDGLSSTQDPVDLIVIIFKFIVKVLMWISVIVVAVILVKNSIKAVNKVHRDEEGKWGAVVGEIIGNAVVVIAVIAFATWINGMLS